MWSKLKYYLKKYWWIAAIFYTLKAIFYLTIGYHLIK
jgi:hypothetical protein